MPNFKVDTQSFLACFLVVSMTGIMFCMMFFKVPESDIFKTVIGGYLTVGFATVIGFYFGSSSGSKSKDDTMNSVVTTLSQSNAPANGSHPTAPGA